MDDLNFKGCSVEDRRHCPKLLNVEIGKERLLKNSDVTVMLKDRIYSGKLQDYMASSGLTDELLTYLEEKNLLNLEEFNAMLKGELVKPMKLPFDLVFPPEEASELRLRKHPEAKYERSYYNG